MLSTDTSKELTRHSEDHRELAVEYLADHPQQVETVARWHHETWQYLSPNTTLDDRLQRIRASAQHGRIPTTLVAFLGHEPVGCASLVTSDMSIRRHLSPWLASVYVVPHLRNTGIGSQMVVQTMQEAKALGEAHLYLYTPDRQSFYARLGWREIETCAYRGIKMSIMQYELARLSDSETA